MSDVKYGLVVAFTENLGDDIQSLAALQFLPRVDYVIYREYMAKCMDMIRREKEVKVIMNGWFMHLPNNWRIVENVKPLFISFHWTYRKLPLHVKRDLKRYEPVGARDLYTQKLLAREGVKSYFSGCLTLTLDYGFSWLKDDSSRRRPIVLVDVPSTILDIVKRLSKEDVVVLSHHIVKYNVADRVVLYVTWLVCKIIRSLGVDEIADEVWRRIVVFVNLRKGAKIDLGNRFARALSYLYLYANAKCVITTRLHAALPAIAFGTPTLLLTKNPKDPRYAGLIRFVDYVKIGRGSQLDMVRKLKEFIEVSMSGEYTIHNIGELRELKRKMINVVRNFIEEA